MAEVKILERDGQDYEGKGLGISPHKVWANWVVLDFLGRTISIDGDSLREAIEELQQV